VAGFWKVALVWISSFYCPAGFFEIIIYICGINPECCSYTKKVHLSEIIVSELKKSYYTMTLCLIRAEHICLEFDDLVSISSASLAGFP